MTPDPEPIVNRWELVLIAEAEVIPGEPKPPPEPEEDQ
jgi:hypothetical protein